MLGGWQIFLGGFTSCLPPCLLCNACCLPPCLLLCNASCLLPCQSLLPLSLSQAGNVRRVRQGGIFGGAGTSQSGPVNHLQADTVTSVKEEYKPTIQEATSRQGTESGDTNSLLDEEGDDDKGPSGCGMITCVGSCHFVGWFSGDDAV